MGWNRSRRSTWEPLEDVTPFEEVGIGLIKHFSHEHHLRFDEEGLDHDVSKECQACYRSVDSSGFYGCTILHCDFSLHTTCANFPKKKEHPVHKHLLTLQPTTIPNKIYECSSCQRLCSGFRYICLNKLCRDNDDGSFKIDVVCASVCEPFEHKVHPHPLYLFSGIGSSYVCGICDKESKNIFTLTCIDCEFTMCFKCATIPVVLRYKHDKHLLTLCGGEDSSDPFWCERCEGQINPKKWFYTCDQCCTTFHIDCFIADSSYVKIGWSEEVEDGGLTFASNNGNSRPVCGQCGVRCLYRGLLKKDGVCFCTLQCYIDN